MNIHPVKTEFAVIFLFILLFCTVHFSTVYVLAGRMSKKYARVDAAGGLRKRAVEVVGILNLHVMNWDETPGAVFDSKGPDLRVAQGHEGEQGGTESVAKAG